MSDRSRSLSPARKSGSRSNSPMSPSNSDEAESSGFVWGDKFEDLRDSTRESRKRDLLQRVTRMAEFSAQRGDYSTTMRINVPDDLRYWLIDELRNRGIYAELEADGDLYMELDEYWSDDASNSSSEDEGKKNDTKVLNYLFVLTLLVMFFLCVLPQNIYVLTPCSESMTNFMNLTASKFSNNNNVESYL